MCEELFERMNYKYEYCDKCYDIICREAVETIRENDKLNKRLEQIDILCDLSLNWLERMITKGIYIPSYEFDWLCSNLEIIQKIIKDMKK